MTDRPATPAEVITILVDFALALEGDSRTPADAEDPTRYGRTLGELIDLEVGFAPRPAPSVADLRARAGLCPAGDPHWVENCPYLHDDAPTEDR